MNKPKLHSGNTDGGPSVPVPDDMVDIEKLWLDPALGDGIVNVTLHNVPVGKPKEYFRTVTDFGISPTHRTLHTQSRGHDR